VLGLVENMSGYACEECGTVGPLFDGDAGEDLSREFGVPLLGKIPFQRAPVPAAQLLTAFLKTLP
jgi:ATP-binding protein involved in chromosome partitioning